MEEQEKEEEKKGMIESKIRHLEGQTELRMLSELETLILADATYRLERVIKKKHDRMKEHYRMKEKHDQTECTGCGYIYERTVMIDDVCFGCNPTPNVKPSLTPEEKNYLVSDKEVIDIVKKNFACSTKGDIKWLRDYLNKAYETDQYTLTLKKQEEPSLTPEEMEIVELKEEVAKLKNKTHRIESANKFLQDDIDSLLKGENEFIIREKYSNLNRFEAIAENTIWFGNRLGETKGNNPLACVIHTKK